MFCPTPNHIYSVDQSRQYNIHGRQLELSEERTALIYTTGSWLQHLSINSVPEVLNITTRMINVEQYIGFSSQQVKPYNNLTVAPSASSKLVKHKQKRKRHATAA